MVGVYGSMMIKSIVLLLTLLVANPAWAGPEMLLMGAVPSTHNDYVFTADPSPAWTLGTGTTWTNPSVTMARTDALGSFSNATLAYGDGDIIIEFYHTGSGGYTGPTINGVYIGTHVRDTWTTGSVTVTAGTGIDIQFYTVSAGEPVLIRKVTVPKP